MKDGDGVVTLVGNLNGRLHVQRQVEDYALRGAEFEAIMGFLTFTMETYERRLVGGNMNVEERDTSSNRYMFGHPKHGSHF